MQERAARKSPRPKGSTATFAGGRVGFHKDAIIHLNADEKGNKYGEKNNPKRQGSASYDRFAHYKDGMSVQTAVEAGVTTADLHHDQKKGFITIQKVE